MRRSSSTLTPKFYQPTQADFDFAPLLAALKTCRFEVSRLRSRCGLKSILYDETQIIENRLDHFAEMLGIEGGALAIQTMKVGHTSGGRSE